MLPMVLAYIVFSYQDLVPGNRTHRGQLIKPPVNLNTSEDESMVTIKQTKKWLLVKVLTEQSCDQSCIQLLKQQLNTMRQVHIAMHRNTDRVERYVLFADTDLLIQVKNQFQSTHPLLKYQAIDADLWQKWSDYILIIDPNNYLIMSYHRQQHSGIDLIKDLTKLLRASQSG